MPEPYDPIKAFLEYLDKEMTIMGILSTFCAAGSALIVDRVASAEHTSFFGRIATDHPIEAFLAAGMLMLASLCFYLQRSWLAHIYGSTCVSIAAPEASEWSPKRWVVEAYTYATWIRYRIGFLLLTVTLLLLTHTIYREVYPARRSFVWEVCGVILILVVATSFQFIILLTHRYSNHPYQDFSIKSLPRDWSRRHTPPKGMES